MGSRYRHFCIEERCEIARRRQAGESLRQIAAALDRSPSSVARELKRNSGSRTYSPSYAKEQAHARRWRGSKLLRDPLLQADVLRRLSKGASPEAVAGRLALEKGKTVSHETIYRFVYAQMARKKDYAWRYLLPRKKWKRGRRSHAGHWEGDLMQFSDYRTVLALHERSSRLTWIEPLPTKEAASVAKRIHSLLAPLPSDLRQSITFDNGTEFAQHYTLHEPLGIETFFCEPYSPWQKGGVENAIGRLRRWLPRKTNLATLTPSQLLQVATLYNHVPRKCLGYQTSAEVFLKLLHFKCEFTSPRSRE